MDLGNVSIPIAFGAGFLSFFSPCILPLIPAYIMYITGVNMEEELEKKRLFALTRTIGFVIGFTIIFMIMGTSASFLGKLFIRNKEVFSKISGGIIILFGLNMMGILKLKFLNFERRTKAPKKITNWFSSILMGMAFAAGWTPCFGPVLASILMYAGGTATISKGVYLLLVYSIGMAIPFILTALFINSFTRFMNKADKFFKYMPIISGLIMIIFGLLVFFNKIIDISRFLL
ncbi:cytochrome c biogenesis CcdA family protein [Tissierella carlieri]|uniref:Cytochrome c biogenesis protein CcdA n=1 Tax=Tissierella carlieri TaxID=689904 RepID=A0ABT1S9X7_9FIRM|nr:cytochrome c biogenesis protein CcdA [Tissierella carlieri]MCQ4923289.1 cytochrome c biogenesis protein CcdA [Tissierella carlieri]MDU5080686.1 cytochrome c biogenesis protein CcdA [Bacillota bacterium]